MLPSPRRHRDRRSRATRLWDATRRRLRIGLRHNTVNAARYQLLRALCIRANKVAHRRRARMVNQRRAA